jgi:amidophosphoribosyltransferase
MPAAKELVGHGRTEDEICRIIGADGLVFQSLDDLIEAVQKKGKTNVDRFDTSVFDGDYVTGDVNAHYLQQLELLRNDAAKQRRDGGCNSSIELHNTA